MYVCGNSHACFSLFKQEEPDTAAMKTGHRILLLRTVDTDVVVFAVSLTQEMYEVVNELRRTVNCCNHRTRHQAGRGKKTVWGTSLKVTNAFLDLASAPLMTFSQPSRDLWYSWYDHTCSYAEINLEKMPDASKENFKLWNSNWIELLTREYIVGDNMLLHIYPITMSLVVFGE